MVQNLIVALIVIAAFAYVMRKYLPASLRRRVVYALSRGGRWQSRLAKWLDTEASCGSGCDTCGACESGAGDHAAQSAEVPPPASPRHRIIPIAVKRH